MLTVDDIEMIRRAYYVEHKSIRAISQLDFGVRPLTV